jgi:hypothetical protein
VGAKEVARTAIILFGRFWIENRIGLQVRYRHRYAVAWNVGYPNQVPGLPGYQTEPNGPAGIRPRPALRFGAPLALWRGRTVDGPVAGLGCSAALESPRRSPRGSCRPLIVSGTQCYSTQPPSAVESISF